MQSGTQNVKQMHTIVYFCVPYFHILSSFEAPYS